ncbi:MAG TPA: hypothetical protein VJK04_02135 [Candidatus Paceibacterota bacterium]
MLKFVLVNKPLEGRDDENEKTEDGTHGSTSGKIELRVLGKDNRRISQW